MFAKPRPWWHGAHVLRTGIGVLFLISGVLKLLDLNAFLGDVLSFQMVFGPIAGWVTVGLPPLEIVLGILLVLGWFRLACFATVSALSIGFATVHGYAMFRELSVKCGCFGQFALPGPWMLVVNAMLLAASLWLLVDDWTNRAVEKPKYRFAPGLLRRAKARR